MKSGRRVWLGVVLVAVMGWDVHGVAAQERAEEDRIDRALVGSNVHSAMEKLGRGVMNVITGWMEIPVTIEKRYNPHDTATSIASGTLLGLVRAVIRTAAGVYEGVTFLIPIPEDYAPLMPPLEYFTHEPSTWSQPEPL